MCNNLLDVSSISFCNGFAYIGQGNSFDVLSSDTIKINSNSDNALLTLDGAAGSVKLDSGAGGHFQIATGGALIECDDGIQLKAIAGTVSMTAANTVTLDVASDGVTIGGDPTIGAKSTLIMKNNNTGNTAQLDYDGTDAVLHGDIANFTVNATAVDINTSNFSVTTNNLATVTIPNETVVRVETAGTLNIDSTGLTSGNDPILRLTNVDNQSGLIKKRSTAGGNQLVIDDSTEIDIAIAGTSVLYTSGYGNVGIGGGGSHGSVFLVKDNNGTYAGMNINSTDDLTLFSGGGSIVANQAIRPDGGILDTVASTGTAGQFLAKDGSNQLKWETAVPGGWAGTATSDLDMNKFSIHNVAGINVERSAISGNPIIALTDTDSAVSIQLEATPASGQLYATGTNNLQVWTGAVEGIQLGNDYSVNYMRGMGLPLYIAQDQGKQSTDRIIMDTIGDGTGGIAIETSEYFDATSTKEARMTSGEVVRLTSSGPTSVIAQSSSGNAVVRVEGMGGAAGGDITADIGATEFVFKGDPGTSTIIRGNSVTSVQALDSLSSISLICGGGEMYSEFSADGSGKGKIDLKVETSATPLRITLDGSADTLSIEGSTIISNSAGSATGKFLLITLNGAPYKIPLYNV